MRVNECTVSSNVKCLDEDVQGRVKCFYCFRSINQQHKRKSETLFNDINFQISNTLFVCFVFKLNIKKYKKRINNQLII